MQTRLIYLFPPGLISLVVAFTAASDAIAQPSVEFEKFREIRKIELPHLSSNGEVSIMIMIERPHGAIVRILLAKQLWSHEMAGGELAAWLAEASDENRISPLPIASPWTVEIQGQKVRGEVYVAPLRTRDGAWIPPTQMIGEYLVVEDPSQEFVYDRTRAAARAIPVNLFPAQPEFVSQAKATLLDDGRLRVAPREGGRLVLGRVVEVGGKVHSWVLSDQGLFDQLVSELTEAIARGTEGEKAYARRANVYRHLREFAKALADSQKAGKPLVVEVVSDAAPLMIESKRVGAVGKGETIRVTQVNGEWLWVQPQGDAQRWKPGWIHQKHVR